MIIAVIMLALGVGARASNFSAPPRPPVTSESERLMMRPDAAERLSL